ncbi:DUF2235 domain-containing protein, partial [Sphaerotilus sp.]|uniref:DUF2235 domain-containing protein n=1 Tax=Sphaerotilus sp. TaxID=2093942 RepID=UPI0034E22853
MAPRQLIVCCDGTNNNLTGRLNDTNVTQLCELLDPDGQDQLLFYDPGVGNPGQLPGTTRIDTLKRNFQRLSGLAFGQGVFENIAEGYGFLVRHYRAGDQIFLYGFSRGAFTARSIGGLVTMFGLLRPESQDLIPTLLHTYFADRRDSQRYLDVAAQISDLFCTGRRVPVWFVGVWDTVASVGFPLLSQQTMTAKPSIVGKPYNHVRQALALDEHRRAFEPRPYIIEPDHDYAAAGQSIEQVWFAGSHCDVGGGYRKTESGLSDEALLWMLQASVKCGLRLATGLVNARGGVDLLAVRARLSAPYRPSTGADAAGSAADATVARAVLHSESRDTVWWALGGLALREPRRNPDWNQPNVPVQAVEHASVTERTLRFPSDSVWSRSRPLGPLLWAAVAAVFFWCLAGLLLAPAYALDIHNGFAAFAFSVDRTLAAATESNLSLVRWQCFGWVPWHDLGHWPWPAPGVHLSNTTRHLGGALVADLGLIASYAYLLARWSSWSFAQVARRHFAADPPRRLLNRLGSMAGWTVGADLVENLATWSC